MRAAEAAECANEQDQFWPYHDTLFLNQKGENQSAFDDLVLKNFASLLGLDEAAFNDCLDSDRYRTQLETERREAEARDVKSTPTFIINGQLINGAIPFEQFQSIIESELAKQ